MKKLLVSAALVGALGTHLFAQQFSLGAKVPALSATSLQGSAVPINPQSSTATVLIFTSTRCPVSNAYNERMDALYKQFSGKGVQFVFLNANSNEPASEVAEHGKSHGLSYPVLKDEWNILADRFGARSTPEAYVLDRTGTLLYHGSVDDAQNPARIQNRPLQAAIEAVLAGKPVPVAETKAFGCTIKRVRKTT